MRFLASVTMRELERSRFKVILSILSWAYASEILEYIDIYPKPQLFVVVLDAIRAIVPPLLSERSWHQIHLNRTFRNEKSGLILQISAIFPKGFLKYTSR